MFMIEALPQTVIILGLIAIFTNQELLQNKVVRPYF